MPRSIQEILDHADELAKRFEDYEPDPPMSAPSRNTSSNVRHWREHAANDRSSTPSSPPAPTASRGSASVNSSAPPPKPHNSATTP